jgi:glutaredoxin
MCGYCGVLKRALDRQGVPYRAVDICAERDQAEIVRAVTGGDEIVPTVQVADRFLVNPSVAEVLALLIEADAA